jgi:hypothetical protein
LRSFAAIELPDQGSFFLLPSSLAWSSLPDGLSHRENEFTRQSGEVKSLPGCLLDQSDDLKQFHDGLSPREIVFTHQSDEAKSFPGRLQDRSDDLKQSPGGFRTGQAKHLFGPPPNRPWWLRRCPGMGAGTLTEFTDKFATAYDP